MTDDDLQPIKDLVEKYARLDYFATLAKDDRPQKRQQADQCRAAVIERIRLLVAWAETKALLDYHEMDACFADDDKMCAFKEAEAEARAAYEAQP